MLALVGTVILSVKPFGPASPSAPHSAMPSPAAMLGAYVGGDSRAATVQLEAAIGRKLAIGHSFVRWGGGLGDLPSWNVAAGRTSMLSFGSGISYRSVASGRYDAWLGSLAGAKRRRAQATGAAPVWLGDGPGSRSRPSR